MSFFLTRRRVFSGLKGVKVFRHAGIHDVRIETSLALSLKKCWPTPPHCNRNPFLSKAVRPAAGCMPSVRRPLCQISYAHASLRFAFGEMLLYQHQRIVTMTKVYIASHNLPVEIIRFHTIGFSDLLSRIRNSTTTGRPLRVYRGPFISEDRSFDLWTALFHVTMYRQFARKVGTSANSALIRYYLPRFKLSSSTLALARERTPIVSIHLD